MLVLKSEPMELRGISNVTSAKGNVYYNVNAERMDGTAYQFYCKDAQAFPQGLKKGDAVEVNFGLTYYKGQPKLEVVNLKKIG